MLESIRIALFRRALRNLLATHSRQRNTHTLASARSIGLLFDAGSDQFRKESLEYAKNLEKNGKKVRLLGFYNQKQPPAESEFDFFFLKELNWSQQPAKSEKANAFVKEKFDLLICLNPQNLPALEWVAAASVAAMKIGPASEHPNDFDLQLDIPQGKGPRYFTEQMQQYLDKIVLTKHESAKTS